jgi:hypothetical protein
LQALGSSGSPAVSPTITGPFTNGEWIGWVTIADFQEEVRLSAQQAADVSVTSNPFLLKATPVQILNVALVRDLVYSPQLGKAYVSIKGSHYVAPGIVLLDPEKGGMENWKFIWYAYPDRLALSRDGQILYATFPYDDGYGRYLTAGGFDVICSFGGTWLATFNVPWQTEDFEVLGQTDLLVATRYFYYDGGGWTASSHYGIAVYPRGNPLPDTFSPGAFGMRLTTSSDGQTVYTTWPGGYAQLAVTSNGVSPVKVLGDHPVPAFASGYAGDLVFDRGLLYRDNGEVVDPNRIELVGRLPSSGLVRPDSAINRVFLLASNGPSGTLRMNAYDQATLVPLGGTNLSPATGTPTRPTRCGTNTLAFVTSAEQIVLLHGLLLPTDPETDLATSLQCVTPTIPQSNTATFALTVTNQGAHSAHDLVVSARLAAGLGPITVTSADGTFSTSDGTMVCTVPLLAAGTAAAVNFEVPARVAGTFPCVASVASRARETAYTNNFSQVTLIVPASSDPTPRVTGVTVGSAGIRLQFPSLGGARYRLEWSANLDPDSWQIAADYIYGTGDAIEVSDPKPRNLPVGFYRLVLIP